MPVSIGQGTSTGANAPDGDAGQEAVVEGGEEKEEGAGHVRRRWVLWIERSKYVICAAGGFAPCWLLIRYARLFPCWCIHNISTYCSIVCLVQRQESQQP